MICLYQFCNKCKTERNFNPETLECLTCKKQKDVKKNNNTCQSTED